MLKTAANISLHKQKSGSRVNLVEISLEVQTMSDLRSFEQRHLDLEARVGIAQGL